MRQVTRHLMSGKTAEASAAIQKVLDELPAQPGASLPPLPTFLRDRTQNKDADHAAASVPATDFVSDLLKRLGVPSPLDGAANGVKDFEEKRASLTPEELEAERAEGHGQFLTKSFTNHAGTRSYKLYIPSSYQGQAMPLMIMLHGCTQNPDDFANGTGMNIVAEESQCFVAYPMQTQAANVSRCWNWFNAVDQQRDQGEPSIIAGITQAILNDYKLDARKVYVAGLSAGGAMAIIMGTTYPDMYAAVGVHSGLPYAAAHDLPSALAAMKGNAAGVRFNSKQPAGTRLHSIPIIAFHGDQDATVSPHNSEQLMTQNVPEFTSNQGENEPDRSQQIRPVVIVQEGKVSDGHRYTQTSHHDDSGRSIAEHWLIHGAGHAWAGGDRSGTYTDGKGPDASREMMRFFSTQSLS
ncbi:PHB depolymerase family esterase [Glaciimonas sp. PAMC28666]|nr:PHB depolymerase family esterase [Glaciimonas sp. PAMC28666]